MSRKISVGAAVALALLLVAGSIPLTMLYAQRAQNKLIPNLPERMQQFQAMEEIRKVVTAEFFRSADGDAVTVEMVRGYIAGLNDPQSRYLTAEEYQAYEQRKRGAQPELGVELRYEQNPEGAENPEPDQLGGIVIGHVKSGSPAAASGLLAGDHITKVATADGKVLFKQADLTTANQAQIIGMLSDLSSALADTASVSLEISYKRGGDIKTPVSVMVGTAVKALSSEILASWPENGTEGEPSVGYIKIFNFYKNTADQLRQEIHTLSSNGATSFIFDLRGCSEGTLLFACQSLNLLVPIAPGNDAMATVSYKDGREEPLPSDAPNMYSYAPGGIAVLIDGNTAGPAELFAYDLQAYHPTGVLLVGKPTRGVSTVQETYPLSQAGGAAMLSVGTVTPLGGNKNWNANGVQPGYWEGKKFVTTYAEVRLNLPGETMQLQNALHALNEMSKAKEG